MAPCDAKSLIEKQRARIAELEAKYIESGDALTAVYLAAGLRPDPEDDMITTSVIRDSVLEHFDQLAAENQRLRADAERLLDYAGKAECALVDFSTTELWKRVSIAVALLRSAIDAARGGKQ